MRKIFYVVIVILGLWFLSYIVSQFFTVDLSDKIAVIPIEGAITTDGARSFIPRPGAVSSKIVEQIKKAEEDSAIKGIILEINSPGGTVVATREIVDAVRNAKKPIVAWIREIGASGAYWIASASDKIVTDELSITGSIGVIAAYLEFSDLFEKYGIKYESVKTGKYKDIASPFKDITEEEKKILNEKLKIIHQSFVDDVAKNRNLSQKTVSELSNGVYYLGKEAYDFGLVDYLGGKELAFNITKELANVEEAKLIAFKEEKGLLDIITRLSENSFYYIGRGIGNELAQISVDRDIRFEV